MACICCRSVAPLYAKSLCKRCYKKQWHSKNRDKELLKYRKRFSLNKEIEKFKSKNYYSSHPNYWRNYYNLKKIEINNNLRLRYRLDFNYRLTCILRARLNQAIRNNYKSGSAIKDLGCSIDELKKYLESKFNSSMNWNNHGIIWEIDHIRALCLYDLSDSKQLKDACHFINLQPISIEEHILKTKEDICKKKVTQEN